MKKLSLLAAALFCSVLPAVENEVNYDESAVKPYTLPALLECKDGRKITTAAEWEKFRRPEILADYTRIMYGECAG